MQPKELSGKFWWYFAAMFFGCPAFLAVWLGPLWLFGITAGLIWDLVLFLAIMSALFAYDCTVYADPEA